MGRARGDHPFPLWPPVVDDPDEGPDILSLDLSPLGHGLEEVGIYRIFAHKFHWTPETIDGMSVPLLAAFQHDFEAERVRMKQAHDDPEGKNKQKRRLEVDPRVPLAMRVQPVHIIDAWIRKWNADHPDAKPIPRPVEKVDFGGQTVPNAPQQ